MATPKAKRQRLELRADFHQLHLRDSRATGDLTDAWTVQATLDRVAQAPGVVGIGTERDESVAVEVEALGAEPPADTDAWDHVTESRIDLPSGELVVLGCTDYEPDAKRISLTAATWHIRASHVGLAKKRERIRLQLWAAERVDAGRLAHQTRVVKRWEPAAAPATRPAAKKRAPRESPVAGAMRDAWRGKPDAALGVLVGAADSGDAAAAASAAEILAYRGRWREMVPRATALIANPRAVRAGNVFTDMLCLVRRAARELQDPAVVRQTAVKVPPGMEARSAACLLNDPAARPVSGGLDAFAAAVAKAQTGKRFVGHPAALARHCFSLAVVFGIDDEIVARWDPANEDLGFDQAVYAARALAGRGELGRAWEAVRGRLHRWSPVDSAQVAPVILLVDGVLEPMMTIERREEVLTTPRGPEALPCSRR